MDPVPTKLLNMYTYFVYYSKIRFYGERGEKKIDKFAVGFGNISGYRYVPMTLF